MKPKGLHVARGTTYDNVLILWFVLFIATKNIKAHNSFKSTGVFSLTCVFITSSHARAIKVDGLKLKDAQYK